MVKSKSDNSKLVSILCYFLVGIIWYFADKSVQNQSTKHHSKQALNLAVISLGVTIVFALLYTIFSFLSPVWGILGTVVDILLLIFWIFGLLFAFKDNRSDIPIIGKFAHDYLNY